MESPDANGNPLYANNLHQDPKANQVHYVQTDNPQIIIINKIISSVLTAHNVEAYSTVLCVLQAAEKSDVTRHLYFP